MEIGKPLRKMEKGLNFSVEIPRSWKDVESHVFWRLLVQLEPRLLQTDVPVWWYVQRHGLLTPSLQRSWQVTINWTRSYSTVASTAKPTAVTNMSSQDAAMSKEIPNLSAPDAGNMRGDLELRTTTKGRCSILLVLTPCSFQNIQARKKRLFTKTTTGAANDVHHTEVQRRAVHHQTPQPTAR